MIIHWKNGAHRPEWVNTTRTISFRTRHGREMQLIRQWQRCRLCGARRCVKHWENSG